MATRTAEAEWQGDLKGGNGRMKVGSGAFEGPYSFRTRFEEEPGTNPEELIGAAHAGCFSMAFANILAGAGHTPTRVHTTAKVQFGPVEGGFAITRIDLVTEAEVPGLSEDEFQKHAQAAKVGCPVSKALAATEITLDARLKGQGEVLASLMEVGYGAAGVQPAGPDGKAAGIAAFHDAGGSNSLGQASKQAGWTRVPTAVQCWTVCSGFLLPGSAPCLGSRRVEPRWRRGRGVRCSPANICRVV